jgi:hypothetical protein
MLKFHNSFYIFVNFYFKTKEEPEDEYDSKFNLDTSNNNAQAKPVDKKIIPRKR